ncbi:hypothetical protein DL89DRAFT_25396 [Linderina pennispora]|uniref:Uncharacterized protein n=1 Tax=Linderina pennispora TaxID=61395 RepID=A0A1Y1WNZ6_9FUNG|nr:uncharacterized protein DL89DRAFT_25396 [Linderina pennispora]ORX74976.1 hypothetical protein DL89DRAFT_25396 [Linderina pennispora]
MAEHEDSDDELMSRGQLLSLFTGLWDVYTWTCRISLYGRQSALPYKLVSYQARCIPGTNRNADFLICYSTAPMYDFYSAHSAVVCRQTTPTDTIPDDALEEMGILALEIWKHQPTRLTVPILLLHGVKIRIVKFNRDGNLHSLVGKYVDPQGSEVVDFFGDCKELMVNLCRVFSLPANEFGHVCEYSHKPKGYRFEPHGNEYKMSAVDKCGKDTFIVSIVGRGNYTLAGRHDHIIYGKFNSHAAVLRVSWIPADQPVEYTPDYKIGSSALNAKPKVLQCGTVVKDIARHRMEFIIYEDTAG